MERKLAECDSIEFDNRIIADQVFKSMTGYYAPGVDIPAAANLPERLADFNVRNAVWEVWNDIFGRCVRITSSVAKQVIERE